VLKNRSAPPALIVPVLTVSDVKAATDWYGAAFGFLEHVRIGTHRAQLGLDGFALIVAEPRPGKPLFVGQILHKVADVAALVERVVELGAQLLDGPTDWEYGERQATLCDPFGHFWVLTQTLGMCLA
jgi:PhnB protein